MAMTKGLLALSTIITLGACASQDQLDKAFNDGIKLGRNQSGQMSPVHPSGPMPPPGYPVVGANAPPLVVMPASGAPRQQAVPAGRGGCKLPRIRFSPDPTGTPTEQQMLKAVNDFLCTPGNPANGTIVASDINGQPTTYTFWPAPK